MTISVTGTGTMGDHSGGRAEGWAVPVAGMTANVDKGNKQTRRLVEKAR